MARNYRKLRRSVTRKPWVVSSRKKLSTRVSALRNPLLTPPRTPMKKSYKRSKTATRLTLSHVDANDIAVKTFSLGSKKKKLYPAKGTGTYVILNTFVQQDQVREGQQLVLTGDSNLSVPAICGADATVRNQKHSLLNAIQNLLPDVYTTSGFNLGQMPATNSTTAQKPNFVVSHIDNAFNLSNMTTTSCEVFIYWLTPKRNTLYDPYTCWADAINDIKGPLPVPGFQTNAAINIGASGGYNTTPDTFGDSPFLYKGFTSVWRSVHSEHLILKSFSQQNFNFRYNVNAFVNGEVYQQLYAEGHFFKAGVSLVPLIIARPALVMVSDTSGGTVAEPVIGMCTLSSFQSMKYHIFTVPNHGKSYSRVMLNHLIGYNHTVQQTMIDEEGNEQLVNKLGD